MYIIFTLHAGICVFSYSLVSRLGFPMPEGALDSCIFSRINHSSGNSVIYQLALCPSLKVQVGASYFHSGKDPGSFVFLPTKSEMMVTDGLIPIPEY